MAGRYKFLEELGKGGAGAVFKAYDTQLDRYVAIKRLFTKAEMEQSDADSGGLRKEAGSLATLQHPNIVSIFDLSSDDEAFSWSWSSSKARPWPTGLPTGR
ncbi:protein kinase domain-containing protein [Verrucomicrobium spinosum]|uniref:protein kinase domain-containing protein n=1 Tax=Verrucomicrobium spinosum TaxID=2736 RepID=UPI0009462ABA|nr:protein kinase [Verrucomicrobium spinosum]